MCPLVTNCISDMETTLDARCSYRASHGPTIRILLSFGLLLGTAIMASCATQSQPAAKIQRLCTSKSSSSCTDWLYAGEIGEVRIEGENFIETWQVDLGKNSQPRPLGSFQAWIGPEKLLDVKKLPYKSNSQLDILQGRLDATLDVGFYPVRIRMPSGTTVSYSGPVAIRTPLFVSAAMEKLHAPVHDTLRMEITLENKSTSALGDIRIKLTQGGTGSVFCPAPVPSFSLDAQSYMDVSLDIVGASAGQPQIQIEASAVTGHGLEVETNEPMLLTLDILDEAYCRVDAQAQPQQLSIGQNLTLIATVKNTGGVALDNATMVIQKTQGQGQLQWSTTPAPRKINPGADTVFTLEATALEAGYLEIYPLITGTEAISERPLEFSPPDAVEVEITQE